MFSIKARQQIWKNKLPAMSDDKITNLSGRFDLSGGQIDNIARKYLSP